MRALFIALAALLSLGGSAAAAILPASPADLAGVLAKARAGDTVRLTPGATYAPAALRNRTFAPALTLDATGAALTGLWYWSRVDGVTVLGGAWEGLRIDYARNITVAGKARFQGPASRITTGLNFVDGANITVSGLYFNGYRCGVCFTKVDGASVTDSAFERMSSDGVDFVSSQHVMVSRNLFWGTEILTVEHPDCIQGTYSTDVTIEDNDCRGATEGVSFYDRLAPNSERVILRRNRITVGYPGGLALYGTRGVILEDNWIATTLGASVVANIDTPLAVFVSRCGNRRAASMGRPAVIEAPCAP